MRAERRILVLLHKENWSFDACFGLRFGEDAKSLVTIYIGILIS